MPRAILSESPQHRTEYIRDEHDESGQVTIRRTSFDDAALAANKRARLEKKLVSGDKLALHDGAEIVYSFSIPSPYAWAVFKRQHPHIAKGLHSRDQVVREKAAADLRAMHPEWVVAAPGRHHF